MRELPILFSAPMIRALLAGTKTQTRRVIKPQPFSDGYYDGVVEMDRVIGVDGRVYWRASVSAVAGGAIRTEIIEPKYEVGDRLWVKETWRANYGLDYYRDDLGRRPRPTDFDPKTTAIEYLADGTRELGGKTRVSIHMPRWASRLTLIVTDVRVERLQDISEADARAEGVVWVDPTEDDYRWARDNDFSVSDMQGVWTVPGMKGVARADVWGCTPQQSYQFLWNSINGSGAWDANPWVVAVSFDVHRGNIDNLPA